MIKELIDSKLKNILYNLIDYDKIIVVGQQRSGTRICAKTISYHLSKKYFDEADFGGGLNFPEMFQLFSENNGVFHAPNGFFKLRELLKTSSAIIFIDRDTNEVEESIKRINWNFVSLHKELLKEIFLEEMKDIKSDNLIDQKKEIWYKFFLTNPNCYTINYEWLKASPLFISKERRKNFTSAQTSLEE